MARALVTGGGGFIGSYLVKALVREGWEVVCVDNGLRSDATRLASVRKEVEFAACDVRDEEGLHTRMRKAQLVCHLAAINGTENFYKNPELVLDVGVRGMLAVMAACRRAEVPDLVVASSAEVYHQPRQIPTDETTALMVPDGRNPRYSYAGSKIVSELIALHYAPQEFRKVQIFRPHNVYGPAMGWKHVIPQFLARARQLKEAGNNRFEIQGDGQQTRAFAYIDDIVRGILTMYHQGATREIYHIGNDKEVRISDLVALVAEACDVPLKLAPGPAAEGAPTRRCPDISKMRALGYAPQIDIAEGLKRTAAWYRDQTPPAADELL